MSFDFQTNSLPTFVIVFQGTDQFGTQLDDEHKPVSLFTAQTTSLGHGWFRLRIDSTTPGIAGSGVLDMAHLTDIEVFQGSNGNGITPTATFGNIILNGNLTPIFTTGQASCPPS